MVLCATAVEIYTRKPKKFQKISKSTSHKYFKITKFQEALFWEERKALNIMDFKGMLVLLNDEIAFENIFCLIVTTKDSIVAVVPTLDG